MVCFILPVVIWDKSLVQANATATAKHGQTSKSVTEWLDLQSCAEFIPNQGKNVAILRSSLQDHFLTGTSPCRNPPPATSTH